MKRLFFRADAAPEVGLGHVRRCAVLAAACRQLGAEIHLLVRRREVAMAALGDWDGALVHEVPWDCGPEEDAQWTLERCAEKGLQSGVIDHYRLDGGYQQVLSDGGLRWLQFGNTGHTHPLLGKWVHDASPAVKREAYLGRLVNSETECFLGPRYALVEARFGGVRAKLGAPQRGAVETVLLTFGGGDDRGAFERALGWLEALGFAGRRVLLTTGLNPQLEVLRRRAAEDGRIELEVDNWQPAEVMAKCQLAITAGGTAVYELACLGVPTVMVSTAENQQATAESWQERGLAVSLGTLETVEDAVAEARIGRLMEDREACLALAKGAWEAVDGRGAERVAAALMAGGATG
jgi:spore coat polysaccharide biosynthesis predicted glycosyltransferase SpsG